MTESATTASKFTWRPIYMELARRLLDFETKQDQLVALLRRLQDNGLTIGKLTDRGLPDQPQLTEIDPFTFMASFTRGITAANRLAILSGLKKELGLVADLPTDFDGIPAAQNLQWWFFAFAGKRQPDDIPTLWKLARAAVAASTPADVPQELFDHALEVNSVGFPKLTMGLYWLKPDTFLPLDGNTRSYLRSKGIDCEAWTHAGYVSVLKRVCEQLGTDLAQISGNAYAKAPAVQHWAGGFGERPRLDAFLTEGYWAIAYQKDTDKRAGKQAWADIKEVQPGHLFAIKGLGGRNDLVVHAIGEVIEVDQEAGRVRLHWITKEARNLKAPPLAGRGSWFHTLVPVTGEAAIREVFGEGPAPPAVPAPKPARDVPAKGVSGLDAILQTFAASSYVFSPSLIRRFHAALHALEDKRFVLLSGLSGTGKTLLTRVYAHAYHDLPLDDANPYYRVIPVRPNWNTPRDLLGYYNPIVGRYESTPFLELLLAACEDLHHAYFAVLDEMNLAPVEHYLSDVLSAMESRQAIPLWSAPAAPRPHAGWREADGPGKEAVRKDLIAWALRVVGGAASTDDIWERIKDHPIHGGNDDPRAAMRRALQQMRDNGVLKEGNEAAVWRLVDTADTAQAPQELALPPNLFLIGTVNVDETTHAFSDKVLDRAFTIELWDVDWDAYDGRVEAGLRATAAWVLPVLRELHRTLATQHLDFGYRTADEILRYVLRRAEGALDKEALDEVIKMKILPKVRGDSRIKGMLEELEASVLKHLGDAAASLAVVRRMRAELQDHGSTRFWR